MKVRNKLLRAVLVRIVSIIGFPISGDLMRSSLSFGRLMALLKDLNRLGGQIIDQKQS